MERERIQLKGEELRAVMQQHYRAFVTDVRATVQPSGEVELDVYFAQQPLFGETPLRAARR